MSDQPKFFLAHPRSGQPTGASHPAESIDDPSCIAREGAELVTNLIGESVRDRSGRLLGSVADTLVDCRRGRITHLIVRSARSVHYLPWRVVGIQQEPPVQ